MLAQPKQANTTRSFATREIAVAKADAFFGEFLSKDSRAILWTIVR